MAYADGELTSDDDGVVSMHLEACPDCREELAGLAQLNAELDRFDDAEVRPYFTTRLRQRIADRQARHQPHWIRRIAVPTGVLAVVLLAALTGSQLGRTVYGWRTRRQLTTSTDGSGVLSLLDVPAVGSLEQLSNRLLSGGGDE